MRKICDNLALCLLLTSCLPESHLVKQEPTPTPEAVPTVLVGADPLAQYQWHLINTGSNYISGAGVAGADINLGTLHDDGVTGYGIKVVVSDEEAELSHEDLYPNRNLSISKNFKYSYSGVYGQNPFTSKAKASHGTAVSGIIAAAMNNAVGGKGVSPEVQIGNYNFIAYQSGTNGSQQLAEQAKAQTNSSVDIFNYSWGAMTCYLTLQTDLFQSALLNGITNYRSTLGSLYIKAAGNEYFDLKNNCKLGHGTTPNYYLGNANFEADNANPYLILVAASNSGGTAANYSTPGANIWVTAPGGDTDAPIHNSGIISTDVSGCETNAGYSISSKTSNFEKGVSALNTNCKYTSELQGTSFAAPVVSGVVALMLQANPDLTWRDVKYILAKTARFPASPGTPKHLYETSFPSLISDDDRNTFNSKVPYANGYKYDQGAFLNTTGLKFHNWYGFGLVDSSAAVAMASNNYSSPFLNKTFAEVIIDFSSTSTLPSSIPDGSVLGASLNPVTGPDFIIESIGIELSTTGASVSDLGIELSFIPDGDVTPLVTTVINANNFSITNNYNAFKMISNAFYMMNAKGTWNIKVIDAYQNGTSGSVSGLKLTFYGHTP